jgi:acyl carrier protein
MLENMAETLPSATYREVVRWLSDRTGVCEDQIGPSTLLRDLVEDSLEFVEVVMAFEDEHGVDVQNPTTPLDSTADLVHYVENLRSGAPSSSA